MKKRLFAVLLGTLVLFQSGGLTAVASVDSGQLHENTESMQTDFCSDKPLHLICKNEEEKVYAHGSTIKKQFDIDTCYDVNAYEIVLSSYEGVNIVEKPTYIFNNGTPYVELAFTVLDSCEIGNINFTLRPLTQVYDEEASQFCLEQNVYCYHDSEYDYVSTVYLDCLSEYSENLKKHLLDIDRQGELIEEVEQDPILVREPDGSIRYSHEVAGYISWTDIDGGVHAADGVKVELYSVNGSTETLVGSTYTVSSGGYSISFSSSNTSQTVKYKVASEGTYVTVKQASSPYSTYKYESSTFSVNTFTKASYTANKSTNVGQSISIQQAMALANKYIYSLDSSYLPNINVAFPDSGGTRYSSSQNKIFIEQNDEFDWDVAQHEYGHYVQDYYNIENNPGYSHRFSDNLADRYSSKSIGVRLAWGEGWATYFAINLQNKMSAASMNIPNVGDTHYKDIGTTIDEDIEYLATNRRKGEANEATVCAVLYDMTDGYDSSEDDNVWFSNSDIWNITKSSNCTTLSEFITAFYASTFPFYTRLNLGSTLTRYNVAAALNSPTGLNTNTPTFSWTPQGGSVNYPNNSFSLVFYNSNYETILETDDTTSTSRQLTSNEWSSIKNSTSTVYYLVKAKQTPSLNTEPETGPYYSTKMTLYPNS